MALPVSVVIPVRNEAQSLPLCLEALANQDYPGHLVETIVVDGHSTDGTRALARRFGARVLLDGGLSVSEARNRGLREATGDVVAFTDGDCVPSPEWLRRLVGAFEADFSLGGVGGGLRVGGSDGLIVRFEDWQALASYRGFITSNAAYRRDVLLEVGGFDPALSCAEDWDLWWRVRDEGHRVAFVPDAVVVHCPVENFGAAAYFRKQFWYARNDVLAFAKRFGCIRDRWRAGRPAAVREPARVMAPAANHALGAALLALGVVSPGALAAGAVVVGSWVGARTIEFRDHGAPLAKAPVFFGLNCLRTVVRGAGTLAALAGLAGARFRSAPGSGATGTGQPGSSRAPRLPPMDRPRARTP